MEWSGVREGVHDPKQGYDDASCAAIAGLREAFYTASLSPAHKCHEGCSRGGVVAEGRGWEGSFDAVRKQNVVGGRTEVQ